MDQREYYISNIRSFITQLSSTDRDTLVIPGDLNLDPFLSDGYSDLYNRGLINLPLLTRYRTIQLRGYGNHQISLSDRISWASQYCSVVELFLGVRDIPDIDHEVETVGKLIEGYLRYHNADLGRLVIYVDGKLHWKDPKLGKYS